jgi:hypothetical protein
MSTLLSLTWEATGSNLGTCTGFPDLGRLYFPQSLQMNDGIVPLIKELTIHWTVIQ